MNNEQWGNIELPGLGDADLLGKNWNKVTGNRQKAKDPKWLQSTRTGSKKRNEENLEWRENLKLGCIERSKDPEWQKNHAEAMANKGPEFKEKIADINRQKAQNPEWLAKNAAANKKRLSKPVQVPWGIFESGRSAGIGILGGPAHVSYHIKKGTEGYKFISQEEYMMLTGKEI